MDPAATSHPHGLCNPAFCEDHGLDVYHRTEPWLGIPPQDPSNPVTVNAEQSAERLGTDETQVLGPAEVVASIVGSGESHWSPEFAQQVAWQIIAASVQAHEMNWAAGFSKTASAPTGGPI